MAVNTSDATYIVCLLVSLICSLGGYVTPYWEVDEISKEAVDVIEIHVGLNYACTGDYPKYSNATQCRALPFFHSGSSGNALTIFAVRLLMTFHTVFLILSVAFILSSFTCHDANQLRRKTIGTTVISLLCCLFGICGLTAFAAGCTRYSSPFDHLRTSESTEVKLRSVNPHASFFLSCAGCTLFTLLTCVSLVLARKDPRERSPSKIATHTERKRTQTEDGVSYIYSSHTRFLDPIAEPYSINSEPPRVETCHVEIFRNLYPQQAA